MPTEQDLWKSRVSTLEEKLSVRNSSIQRSAVWEYIQHIFKNNGGVKTKEPQGLSNLTSNCLKHSSPLVSSIYLEGLSWLVDQEILIVEGALEIMIQNVSKIPNDCLGQFISLLFSLISKQKEYSTDTIVFLVKNRKELMGEILSYCSVLTSSNSPFFKDNWEELLKNFLNYYIKTVSEKDNQEQNSYREIISNFLFSQIEILSSSNYKNIENIDQNKRNQRSKEILQYLSSRIEEISISSNENFLFHIQLTEKIIETCGKLNEREIINDKEFLLNLQNYFNYLISIWIEFHENSLIAINQLEIQSVSLTQNYENKTKKQNESKFVGVFGEIHKSREIHFLISLIEKIHFLIKYRFQNQKEIYENENHFKNLLFLAYLLLDNNTFYQEKILLFLDDFLTSSLISFPFCKIFVFPRLIYPLLQVMSSPIDRIKSLSSKILYRMEKFGSSSSEIQINKNIQDNNEENLFLLSKISKSGIYIKFMYLIDFTVYFYSKISSNDNFENEFLNYFNCIYNNMKNETNMEQFFIFWISPFLFHSSITIRKKICFIISKFSELKPENSIGLLPFLLYHSEKERNSEIQFEIFKVISSLACNIQMLSPIYKALSPLLINKKLIPFIVRLLCRIWKKQDRSFRQFQKILLSFFNFNNTSNQDDISIQISICLCIRDICKERPIRGKEFINQISEMINFDQNEIIKSLGIQCIYLLCISDCIDFKTAWNIIKQKLQNDNRSIIQESKIKLLECTFDFFDLENNEEESLFYYHEIWNGISSSFSNIRNSAYQILYLFYEKFPDLILHFHNQNKDEFLNVIIDYDCNSLYSMRLGKFILNNEINLSRRKIEIGNPSSSSSIMGNSSNHFYNHLLKLSDFIENSYIESKRPAVRSGLAGGNLWCFSPSFVKKSSGNTILGELKVKIRNYELRCNELIQEVFMSTWITRTMGFFAWIRFSYNYFKLLIEYEKEKIKQQQEQQQQNDKNKSSSSTPTTTIDYEKQIMNSFITLIKQKRILNPAASENSIMALCGFTLALPLSRYDLIEENINFIITLLLCDENQLSLDHQTNEREQFACIISISCLISLIPLSDYQKIKEIYEKIKIFYENHKNNEWFLFACPLSFGFIGYSLLQKITNFMHNLDISKKYLQIIEEIRENLLYKFSLFSSSSSSKEILGISLGLSFFVSSYSNSKNLKSLYEIFNNYFENEKQETKSMFLSGICITFSSILLRCYRLNIINNEIIMNVIGKYQNLAFPTLISSHGNIGACICFGSLIHGSILYGLSNYSKNQIENLIIFYLNQIKNEKFSDTLKESYLIGLSNLIGANLLIPLDGNLSFIESTEYLQSALNQFDSFTFSSSKFIEDLKNLFENSNNSPRLNIFTAWVLGSLSRPLPPSRNFSSSSTLSILQKLPDGNLLKSLLIKLHENLIKTETQKIANENCKIFECLCEVPSRKLPLIDWSPLLQPLVKSDHSLQVRIWTFKFAFSNCSNSSISHFLSCFYECGDFNHLPFEIKLLFIQSIPKIIEFFSEHRANQLIKDHSSLMIQNIQKLKTKNENLFFFQNSKDQYDLISSWISCLSELLSSSNISSSLKLTIEENYLNFFNELPIPIKKSNFYPYFIDSSISSIFSLLSIEIVKYFTDYQINKYFSIKNNDFNDYHYKSFIILCLLVKQKKLPISSLFNLRTFCFLIPDVSFASVLLIWMIDSISNCDVSIQRSYFKDSIDCLLILHSPLTILRFMAWFSLIWSNSDLNCFLLPKNNLLYYPSNICEIENFLFDESHSPYLIFTIERLIPYILPQLLYKFIKFESRDDIFTSYLDILKAKLSEINNLRSQKPDDSSLIIVEEIFYHTISLLCRQTGK